MLQEEKGSILVIILILMLGLLLMGTALVHIMSAEQMMAENHTRAQQAFYLADAGIEKARAMIDDDVSILFPPPNSPFEVQFDTGHTQVEIKAPDSEGLVRIESWAELAQGARRKIEAQLNLAGKVGILANKLEVVQGENPEEEAICDLPENIAASQIIGYKQLDHYSGYVFPTIELDYFRQLASSEEPNWRFYEESRRLTANDFVSHAFVFVEGDVHLDEHIMGLPEGCLLVATGKVLVCPNPDTESGKAALNVICGGDLSIKPDGECFLGLDGYLHSNARLEVDGGGAAFPIRLNGVWEAKEILIRCPPQGLVFTEYTSYVKNQKYLRTLRESLVSYHEAIWIKEAGH